MQKNLVNISSNNIFAFWESPTSLPAYLELCKETWIKNISNCEIHIINYDNIHKYLGDIYDIAELKKIPLAMQSDIISAAILEKFGGLFLDLDCIVIDDIFQIFDLITKGNKLVSFGRAEVKAIHLAVLYCKTPNNPILKAWRIEAQKRLMSKPKNYSWDYFGNEIINSLLKNSKFKNDFYIIDRTASGNILESAIFSGSNLNNAITDYKNLYFNEYLSISPNALSLVNCGVISLHNSWTPKKYKEIIERDEFLKCPVPIAKLLDYILKHETNINNRNSYPIIEAFLLNKLSENKISYSYKYFNDMLVIDFFTGDKNFAFDVHLNENKINLDFISRNIDMILIKSLLKNNLNFINNKAKIASSYDKYLILDEILSIYKTLNTYFCRNKDNINVLVDLKSISIVENKLFIEGIGIIFDISCPNWSDINYELLLVGEKTYIKKLEKLHKPELTSKFSTNKDIVYDKCWFATYGLNGIDISNINKGKYTLQLKITTQKIDMFHQIASISGHNINNDSYQIIVNNTNCTLIIK